METCPQHLNLATDMAVTKATVINTNIILTQIKEDIKEQKETSDLKIAVLEERVANWMDTTTQYRLDLCGKLDHITKKLDTLPCDRREGGSKSLNRQVAFMWVVLTGVVLGLLRDLFAK